MTQPLMEHLFQTALDNAKITVDPETGVLLVQLLRRSIEQNDNILKEYGELKASLAAHTEEEADLIRQLIRAFPTKRDGTPDFDGHEQFHSALISESKAREAFFRDLRLDLAKKSLWALMLVLAALISYWWTGQIRGQ